MMTTMGFMLHYIPLQMDLKTFFTLCTEGNKKKRMRKVDENGIIFVIFDNCGDMSPSRASGR